MSFEEYLKVSESYKRRRLTLKKNKRNCLYIPLCGICLTPSHFTFQLFWTSWWLLPSCLLTTFHWHKITYFAFLISLWNSFSFLKFWLSSISSVKGSSISSLPYATLIFCIFSVTLIVAYMPVSSVEITECSRVCTLPFPKLLGVLLASLHGGLAGYG